MAMTVRRYEVAYGKSAWVGFAFIVVVLGSLWTFWKSLGKEQLGSYQVGFWVLWLAIVLFGVFRAVTSAREIIIHEGDEIEFVSRLKRQRIMARDVRLVKVLRGEHSQVVVQHSTGKIYLAGAMNDFHQFVTDLKQANPAVRSIGC